MAQSTEAILPSDIVFKKDQSHPRKRTLVAKPMYCLWPSHDVTENFESEYSKNICIDLEVTREGKYMSTLSHGND